MDYRSVGSRCAIDVAEFTPEFGTSSMLNAKLVRCRCTVSVPDVIAVARSYLGQARYRRGARMHEAPAVFDCSSFTKWVYGQVGIWIPRRTIQQIAGGLEIQPTAMQAGDLIFRTGYRDYVLDTQPLGVGHVGIVTSSRTVIHAAGRKTGITETPIEPWLGSSFRGIRRWLPTEPNKIWTVMSYHDDEIETSDDLKWILRIKG